VKVIGKGTTVRVIKVWAVSRGANPCTRHVFAVVDVIDQFREALHPMLTRVPADNPLKASFVADCKSKVFHDAAHKGLHCGDTASTTDRGISLLGQSNRSTNILRRLVRLLDFK